MTCSEPCALEDWKKRECERSGKIIKTDKTPYSGLECTFKMFLFVFFYNGLTGAMNDVVDNTTNVF